MPRKTIAAVVAGTLWIAVPAAAHVPAYCAPLFKNVLDQSGIISLKASQATMVALDSTGSGKPDRRQELFDLVVEWSSAQTAFTEALSKAIRCTTR